MDELRKIRFLFPPVIFIAMIYSAIAFDSDLLDIHKQWEKNLNLSNTTAVGALGAVISAVSGAVALGFVIGTISITLLRFLKLCKPRFSVWYEDFLLEKQAIRIWESRFGGSEDTLQPADFPHVCSLFLHSDYLQSGHRDWINRRWNAFNLNLHSAVGVALAMFVVGVLKCDLCYWWLVSLLLLTIFILAAIYAWYDILKMAQLLALVKYSPIDTGNNKNMNSGSDSKPV